MGCLLSAIKQYVVPKRALLFNLSLICGPLQIYLFQVVGWLVQFCYAAGENDLVVGGAANPLSVPTTRPPIKQVPPSLELHWC